jgi:hypothetical protein
MSPTEPDLVLRGGALPATPQPVVIPAWTGHFVRLLDELIRIPGTNIRLGLDSIVGFLLPQAGDALMGVTSLAMMFAAFQMRLPKVVIVRMGLNIAIDSLLGSIPLIGDIFDIAFKANRKNLELLQRYQHSARRKATVSDYVVVLLAILLCLFAIALPIFLLIWLLRSVMS